MSPKAIEAGVTASLSMSWARRLTDTLAGQNFLKCSAESSTFSGVIPSTPSPGALRVESSSWILAIPGGGNGRGRPRPRQRLHYSISNEGATESCTIAGKCGNGVSRFH
jgi:hypothetical protein